jgi:pimeloyl-ACP methyl ester carboxylesterase
LPDTGWERGVTVDSVAELTKYWIDGFDWRAQEARLNAFPNYLAAIDGQNIHFIHQRSKEPDATPLLLVHSWPGSVIELLDLIEPLTDPVAHGGKAQDAFHVVIPSVPGVCLPGPVTAKGWDLKRASQAFATLMAGLGYEKYGVHGGDFGAMAARDLGFIDPEHLIGAHVLQFFSFPSGDPSEFGKLTPEENRRLGLLGTFMATQSAFATLQSTRPQTLAFSLLDSPVGQLAWIYDLYADFGRRPTALSKDKILANASLYWLTETGGSAAAVYFENAAAAAGLKGGTERSTIPMGVSVFGDDFLSVRTFAERDNANIVRWTEFPKGGHFVAMEGQPDLLVGDIRAFFADLKT